MRTLIIIPAYCEGPVVGDVVREVRAVRPDADVVVIDDCSSDDTGAVARDAGAKVVRLSVNLGIGGAVQTGFKYAAELDYDAVVQVDGDGQHDPGELAKILDPLREGQADVVIGSRFVEKSDYRAPFARRVGIALFGIIAGSVMERRIADTTSGFRALGREAFHFLARNYPVDFPDAETLVLLHRAGFQLLEVPVSMRPRRSGTSSTRLLGSLYYPFKQLLGVVVALLRHLPEQKGPPRGTR